MTVENTRERLRSSFWFLPSVLVVGSAVAAIVLIAVDHRLADTQRWALAYTGGAGSARSLMSTVAASLITFLGLTFSMTMVVLQLTSSQYSPRALRQFLRDRQSQLTLGVFVSTFTYVVLVLRAVRGGDGVDVDFVPALATTGALILLVASLGAFVAYIHHIIQSIRPETIIRGIGDEALALVEERPPLEPGDGGGPQPSHRGPRRAIAHPGPDGNLQTLNHRRLKTLAGHRGVRIEVLPAMGDFVPRGAPLLVVSGESADGHLVDDDACKAVTIGLGRTMQHDLAFGFRQLVDVAARCLSPALNDATTAVMAIDHLHGLLRRLAGRQLPDVEVVVCDDDGTPLVWAPGVCWDDLVDLAFDEIRRAGAGSLQINRRLRAAVDDLCGVAPAERRVRLEEQLRLIEQAAGEEFRLPADRRRAAAADAQGTGGRPHMIPPDRPDITVTVT